MGKIINRQIIEVDVHEQLFKLVGDLPLPNILIDDIDQAIYTRIPTPGINQKINLYRRSKF